MKRIDNIIFIILIICFFICIFFSYQLFHYKLPEIILEETIPQTIKSINPPEPPPSQPLIVDLPNDRNMFKTLWEVEENIGVAATTALPKPYLSTIFWSDELPLAIINGEILTQGDKDAKAEFQVEIITPDKVGIRFIDNGKYMRLTLDEEEEELSSFAQVSNVQVSKENTFEK